MIFKVVCSDAQFEHNVEDVEFYLKKKSPISETFRHIENTLNLDRQKFDYFIDFEKSKIIVTATQELFKSNLRNTKLSDILNLTI